MGYLIASITCAVTMALLLKISEKVGMNSLLIIGCNYLSGSLAGWLLIALDGGTSVSIITFWLGLEGGLLWPLPFFILTRTIRLLGVAIAAPLARFGLIIPVLYGLLILGEGVSLLGSIGLLGAFIAILLISPLNSNNLRGINQQALWLIPIMIILIGFANMWINLFNTIGDPQETNLFFTLIFTFASLFTFLIIWQQKTAIQFKTVQRGFLIGLPNFFYTYFLLGALRAPFFQGNSASVYIILNVIYIILVFAAGALIWRESVTRKNIAGIGVAAMTLILLNLR